MLRGNDTLCLIETKIDDLDEINLMGYTFKMQNREKVKRVKSGVITLSYKDCLDVSIEPIDTDCKFVLWCKISKLISNDDVILGIIYVPPEYTSYSSPDAFNHIENYYLNLFTKYKKVFVCR